MIRLTPGAGAIEEAARVILSGGVVAVPTDTLYGLAADPRRPDAVARVAQIKGRRTEQAVPLIAADLAQAIACLGALPSMAQALAEAFWPGPLTLLVLAPPGTAPDVAGGTGRVGVRVPAHDVARALCRACGWLLTATSANVTGAPASASPDEVARSIGPHVDMLLDAGMTPGGAASTIVDVTGSAPQLVREGAVAWNRVLACVDRG